MLRLSSSRSIRISPNNNLVSSLAEIRPIRGVYCNKRFYENRPLFFKSSLSRPFHGRYNSSNNKVLGVQSLRFQSLLASSDNEIDPTIHSEIEDNDDEIIHSEPASSKHTEPMLKTEEIRRLVQIRNVGVFAHVDAGKTTVTERMLALAGVVRQAGSVDDGNTVTDYLPAERERGITIQCAAISFPWSWHNKNVIHDELDFGDCNDDGDPNVTISLIDTPGHVDFSVEVNRSVAVLDGAVLVVDAVAGVQAQTETVWKAMTNPSLVNNHVQSNNSNDITINPNQDNSKTHHHEPLPCLVLINKMDKEGCHFFNAINTIRWKLPGANPIPLQLPLFRKMSSKGDNNISNNGLLNDLVALPITSDNSNPDKSYADNTLQDTGDFVGVVDLVHMRAIIWPDSSSNSKSSSIPENCIPRIIPLVSLEEYDGEARDCSITQTAIDGRWKLVESLAECGDSIMEEYYLQEVHPPDEEFRAAIRRVTLSRAAIPVLAGAALRGKGVEPLLDAIADYLPSPLDREPPTVTHFDPQREAPPRDIEPSALQTYSNNSYESKIPFGHSLHPSLLAFAFKVVHMKGRGGSGDGRVVFARVYSGTLRDRDVVQVMSPASDDTTSPRPRKERIGGMLELAGGKFSTIQHGECKSGGVCALVGLKSVVTGDTIAVFNPNSDSKGNSKKRSQPENEPVCLAGVASPKPVLKVRLEAETTEQQNRLSEALALLAIEDPSLVVEETESSTLLAGLGELHIDVTLDRLKREFGINVLVGTPSVTYRETITEKIETDGLHNYDRMIGGTRLQAAICLSLEPTWNSMDVYGSSTCMMLQEPTLSVSDDVKQYLELDPETSEADLLIKSELYRSVVQGCKGALKRGPSKSHAMSNLHCHVALIDAENGLPGLQAMPGSLRAAAADAISNLLTKNRSTAASVLEPKMSIEITLPNDMVGTVLSDLTTRRGTISGVFLGDARLNQQPKALIRGDVPLVEILGYANSLRSITGGEGAFTAEYKGHSPV